MTTNNDRFGDLFTQISTVFTDEEAFSPLYIPKDIKCRDKEIKELAYYFKSIASNPSTSKAVTIQGSIGSGKTTVAKFFSKKLGEYIRSDISYNKSFTMMYVNVRNFRSPYNVYTYLLRQLSPAFPLRGFSLPELQRLFRAILNDRELVVLLILDEIDYLWKYNQTGNDFLYSLLRNHEEDGFQQSMGLNLLLITRDPDFRLLLDSSTESSLSKTTMSFSKYSAEDLLNIVEDRAKIGLKNNTYTQDILKHIARISQNRGDARLAIELLWRAGKIADRDNSEIIQPEHIREARVSVFPINREIIKDLRRHHCFLLLGIIRAFQDENESSTIPTTIIRDYYNRACEEYRTIPRKATQLWEYVKELSILGLISIEVVNRHSETGKSLGRISMVSLVDIPVNSLIEELEKQLQK